MLIAATAEAGRVTARIYAQTRVGWAKVQPSLSSELVLALGCQSARRRVNRSHIVPIRSRIVVGIAVVVRIGGIGRGSDYQG